MKIRMKGVGWVIDGLQIWNYREKFLKKKSFHTMTQKFKLLINELCIYMYDNNNNNNPL